MRKRKTKAEIHIRFSKWSENEKQKAKFKSFFQCHAKTKNVNGIWIPFSHAIEKRLALRYTHLLASRTWNFTRKPRKQNTRYVLSLNIMSRSRDPPSWKETLLARFQIQIKVKKWSSSCKYLLQKKIKAEVIVTFQNILSSMNKKEKSEDYCKADLKQRGRLAWCSIGAAMQLNKGKKNLCRNGLKFSIAWGGLKISRWPLHSFKIFEAYLINSLRFSKV